MKENLEEKTLNALKWIIDIFNNHKIDYQISGGFAAKIYGSNRKLNDIDIDISEKSFPEILSEISKYITYGPDRYVDGKWDLELITLNYEGQEIDICGVETLRMSNKERTKWITSSNNIIDTTTININGIDLKIINPNKLIEYKKELDGDHQLKDIQAVQNYLFIDRG